MKKIRKNMKVFSIFMLVAILIIGITNSNIYAMENTEEKEIREVVESFISKSFNFGISDYDKSLIDPESKTFLKYFKLRNEYREKTLKSVDMNKDNYKHISTDFKFNKIQIEKNIAYVHVTENFTSEDYSVKNDPAYSMCQDEFDVVLRKIENRWKIHACKSYDNLTNQYDMRVEIGDLVNRHIIGNIGKNRNLNVENEIKLEKLEKDINDYLNKPAIDLNQDVQTNNKKQSFRNGVNRYSMKQYMKKYAYNYNTKNYRTFSRDCANFGSQILVAGGATKGGGAVMDGEFQLWDTKNGPSNSNYYGHAWTVAKYLRGYIVRNNSSRGPIGYPIKWGSRLETGDFCFLDLKRNGGISHTLIVYEGGSNFRISAHTSNRLGERIDSIHPEGKNGDFRSYIKIKDLR